MRLFLVWDSDSISEQTDTVVEDLFQAIEGDSDSAESIDNRKRKKTTKVKKEKSSKSSQSSGSDSDSDEKAWTQIWQVLISIGRSTNELWSIFEISGAGQYIRDS